MSKAMRIIVGRFFKKMCLLVAGVVLASAAIAQDTKIVLQTVDGRNGKPLTHQRLLLFAGQTEDDLRRHQARYGVVTDKHGLATFTITSNEPQWNWLQVWVDGLVPCQTGPNSKSFSVRAIMTTGLATPNTCSSLVREVIPGHFVVFARPARLAEKMRQ